MVSPSALLLALLSGPPTVVPADGPVWVFFADKAVADAGPALAERRRTLDPRALARRVRTRGDAGVDLRDLPPAPAYVAAVLATGARLRASSRWLNAVSVDADAAQLAAIQGLPGVVHLQPVARRRNVAPPETPRSHGTLGLAAAPHPSAVDDEYGVAREQLDMLQVPSLHSCGFTGAGVVVGVQDSGFSLEHAALAGVHVVAARDFLNDDDIVADEPGDAEGQHDHGTMILSLLAGNDPGNYMGAAPGISVILSKTEDASVEEPFEEDRFVEGLEWSEAMGADLFTSSLGYFDWYTPQDYDGKTAITTQAAAVAVEQGLIMFGSIGNTGPGPMTLIAPSDADGLIAVGAVDYHGVVAEFSSRGPTADGRIKPDIAAPGQGVWVANPKVPDDYFRGNGTSLATPLAAGAAALLLEAFPDLDPTTMRAMLQRSSSLADTPNNDLGWGLLNAGLPVAMLCECIDADADGACGEQDCDDADPAVHPGASEVCDDGLDNDCNLLRDQADPACAGDSDGDAGTAGTASGDAGGAGDSGGSANGSGASGEPGGGGMGEGSGCSVGPAGGAWLTAFLLPRLLLGARRRRLARRRRA